ncbi:hypothetical protein [Mesoterricola sediminis]|uniref:Uncharacterized protein n=1 Tax=Mesoterricola sediminis TaxID=2927980 RepID=A0AA48HER6_9BACT|nr:hypothetical protein [Mesoterricola sediminis]BDU76908.1 hypothetical protein METESE_18660 [Mesoterricola sediminis]
MALAKAAQGTSDPATKTCQILFHAMALEGNLPRGPNLLNPTTPIWSKYLLPFMEGSPAMAFAEEYQAADLAFLDTWVSLKGPAYLKAKLKALGYTTSQGRCKAKDITEAHRRAIVEGASALFAGAAGR